MKGRSGVRRSYIIKDFLRRPKLFLLAFASGIVLFYACLSATTVPAAFTVTRNITALVAKRPAEPCQYRHDAGFLTAVSSELVDASGCRVYLTGVNWFGFETSSFAPHGLGVRNWQDMLNQIAQSGFNTIRLPFSDQLFDPSSVPQGINYLLNPDLKGLQGLALMDKIIEGAHKVGLKVILDHHDASADERSGLWYNDQYPQSRWIVDWVMLAQHYRGNDTVVGADLDNEPHNPATWGDGNPYTDWRLAAEQAGDSILAANPDWLIIVQGIDVYQGDSYWWGGNLEGAAKHPVILSHPDKLVYSAHDYGPSVYDEQWFKVPNPSVLTHTLPAIWDKHWGYLQKDGVAPVFVGEFGGPSMGHDIEGVWQRTLISYLQSQGISYAYWAWNADSGDTGGIVNSDWKTVNQSKMNALSAYQWPLLGQP